MKRGDVVEAEILRLDFPDKGIGEVTDPVTGEKVRTRVRGVLPGQSVRCRIVKNGTGRKEARLLEVIKRAPIETETPCPHFADCGGCSYQRLTAENELALKEEQVHHLLDGVLSEQEDPPVWDPALDSPLREGYRNKMEFTWGDEYKDGPLALGLHRRGGRHDIVSVTDCRIMDADYRRILAAALLYFSPLYEKGAVDYYHRMSGEGYLRHLLVRKGAHTGEILIDLVTTSEGGNELLEGFVRTLLSLSTDGEITGILHTVNDARADAVIDQGTTILYGRDHFHEKLLELSFRISPFSFFQTNSHSAEVLYSKVREYVRLALAAEELSVDEASELSDNVDSRQQRQKPASLRKPVVYDLYSGTGTIAQLVSHVSSRVAAIEIVPEAVEAARKNAAENGIENCDFYCGDVLKLVDDPAIIGQTGHPDLIILDPPREGIHPAAIPKIISFGVDHIIYVSCKPTSLARDLQVFLAGGYRAERLCVINQFPFAVHVECVTLLQRMSNTRERTITLDVEMEDYYRLKNETEKA